jgi:SAM-dependent methyltransferase
MNSETKILSSEDLKSLWDGLEKNYAIYMGNNLFPIYPILANIAKLKQNFQSSENINILELSTGAGDGLCYLVQMAKLNNKANKRINIYGTDLSPNMLKTTFEKLKQIDSVAIYCGEEKMNTEHSISIHLSEADNEKLPFQDNFFDVVLSSLSLHIVSSPNKMLSECSRVSKVGSLNAFSVWGKSESSIVFTIIGTYLQKHGINIGIYVPTRSQFHLGQDDKALKQLVIQNGYSQANLAHSFIPFDIVDPNDFDYVYISSAFKSTFEQMVEEKSKLIKDEIRSEIEKVLNSAEMIGLDTLLILARK